MNDKFRIYIVSGNFYTFILVIEKKTLVFLESKGMRTIADKVTINLNSFQCLSKLLQHLVG